MALEYKILFSTSAPALAGFLLQLPAVISTRCLLVQEARGWLIVDDMEELVLSISNNEEAEYLEFSFGLYHYQSSWYIRFNTSNRFLAMEILLELLKQLLIAEVSEFVAIFNGELVVLRKDKQHVYLNTLSGTWKDSETLAHLPPIEYVRTEYPVT